MIEGTGVVHTLTGPAAVVIACVIAGTPIPPGHDAAVAALVNAGVLSAGAGVTRRQVLAAGSAAVVVGVATLTLPAAAAAASPVGSGPDSNLVVNGSFEDGPLGGAIEGWTVQG